MGSQNLFTGLRLKSSRCVDKSNNSMMANTTHDRKFAEVLIKSNKDALFVTSKCKEGFVAWIFRPITDPNDFVAAGAKFGGSLPPYTCIQEELHFAGVDSM